MKQIKAIVVGTGSRGNSYAERTLTHSNEIKIVGVADPDKQKRQAYLKKFGIEDCEHVFDSWEDIMTQDKLCDALIITTQDNMHYDLALQAMEKGYDLLLEKPMAQNPQECYDIAKKADELGRTVIVCHVLRYTPLFTKLKELLDSKIIGDMVSLQHNENVGFFHFAHSFVRGPYANAKESNPFIVAKCCHDMDLINWLVGKKCLKLSSFGSLKLFREENAPPNSPLYCAEGCPSENDCPYSALGYLITGREGESREIFARHIKGNNSEEKIADLKVNPRGRCVFKCGNDVVDHQVVNMEYEDGITVDFSVAAFTKIGGRTLKVMGTKGEIRANTETEKIEVFDFINGHTTTIDIHVDAGGHSGGDGGIVRYMYERLNGIHKQDLSDIWESYEAHALAFAAEKSRLENRVVNMDEFR